MRNILIGFVFILFDFNLNLGNIHIGLIPDFVGYIMILSGLDEMSGESSWFIKVKPYVTGMVIYSVFLYAFDLFGLAVSLKAFSYILSFLSTIISLYITYNIVMGVIDMEGKYNMLFNGSNLKSIWKLLAIFNVVVFVFMLIPIINIFSMIVTFIIAIYFLVAFSRSKNMYYCARNNHY